MRIIKPGFDPKDQEVVICDASITYSQAPGCCSERKDPEELTISIHDGGGGPYLELKTDQWSIEDPGEISDILRHFMHAVGIEGEDAPPAES